MSTASEQKGSAKLAQGDGGTLLSAAGASPLPQPQVVPRIAPGKRGPIGMAHRNNFSRVNTGTPPVPDAGASSQKSLSPKYGSIMTMNGTMAARPTLQDMVKAAQDGALSRASISEAASRISGDASATKTASAAQDQSVPTEYVEKLASALDFLSSEFKKEAEPGKGPGALPVSQATASTSLPPHHGQGHQQPPKHPGEEKARPSDSAANALETNMHHATPGKGPTKIASDLEKKNLEHLAKVAGGEKAASKDCCEKCNKEKSACMCKSAEALFESNLQRLQSLSKEGEDRINPAKISAGKAVPPETSAAGESGGEPVGGKPGPGMDLVSTTKGAIRYTKGQAKAGPKSDLRAYFKEPALTSSTDSTLRNAFDSTGQAGTKFGSAGEGDVKVAAARALLETLLDDDVQKKASA